MEIRINRSQEKIENQIKKIVGITIGEIRKKCKQ